MGTAWRPETPPRAVASVGAGAAVPLRRGRFRVRAGWAPGVGVGRRRRLWVQKEWAVRGGPAMDARQVLPKGARGPGEGSRGSVGLRAWPRVAALRDSAGSQAGAGSWTEREGTPSGNVREGRHQTGPCREESVGTASPPARRPAARSEAGTHVGGARTWSWHVGFSVHAGGRAS